MLVCRIQRRRAAPGTRLRAQQTTETGTASRTPDLAKQQWRRPMMGVRADPQNSIPQQAWPGPGDCRLWRKEAAAHCSPWPESCTPPRAAFAFACARDISRLVRIEHTRRSREKEAVQQGRKWRIEHQILTAVQVWRVATAKIIMERKQNQQQQQ